MERVKLHCKDEVIEGVLIPSQDSNFIVVKLDSGYNIGVKKNKVAKLEKLPSKKKVEKKSKTKVKKTGKPKITILHTGGTIASKVDYETGGVHALFSPEEIINMFPELKNIADVDAKLVSNMWSEDMNFRHYNIMLKAIEKEVKNGVDGVIISHGTDTMHYTSAALSFGLEHLSVPVLVVGSQRSSDRGSSDAAINLLCAALFIITQKNFADVAVCMHENTSDDTCVVLPGTKCRKFHSSRRDAFKAVNTTPIARVSIEKKKVELISNNYHKKSKEKLKVHPFKENIKVGLLKAHPNMNADQIKFYKGYDGLVLEGVGLAGNMPINEHDATTKENSKIANAIRDLNKKGTVVATSTQTIFGRVNMDVYSTGRRMQELGIIGNNHDMTPETAFIKLAWLLSNHKKKEDVKRLFCENLRGEISDRTEKDTFLE